jgi:hypothetical protein
VYALGVLGYDVIVQCTPYSTVIVKVSLHKPNQPAVKMEEQVRNIYISPFSQDTRNRIMYMRHFFLLTRRDFKFLLV